MVQQQQRSSELKHSQPPPLHEQGSDGTLVIHEQGSNGSSSSYGYAPVPPAAGHRQHHRQQARTRVKVVRLEKEVADVHLREAALRGKGPEQVKVRSLL